MYGDLGFSVLSLGRNRMLVCKINDIMMHIIKGILL